MQHRAWKTVASLALALSVLLMHSQVADAAVVDAMAMPAAVTSASMTGTSASGWGHSMPGPGGCAGHGTTCAATVHQPGVTVVPPPACLNGTSAEPAGSALTSTSEPSGRDPHPPAPVQALLQVWRC